MLGGMDRAKPEPQDEPETPVAKAGAPPADPPVGAPFDWQVLLLRYLPDPRGTAHVIKRLAPR